jgi:hypothetical protein
LVEKHFEQTKQLNNLLDENSHKHRKNFPPKKPFLMIETLCVDLVSHATLLQSSQKQQMPNNNETKFSKRERGRWGKNK